MGELFYGRVQSAIHHEDFGRLAGWAANDLIAELQKAGLRRGTVVDLGSGSGILSRHLVGAGYQVMGVDISEAMVDLARSHVPGGEFQCQSLWDFELPPCVAVAAVGEALNYTIGSGAPGRLALLAERVHRALVPLGIFLFDVATPGRAGPDAVAHQFHDRDRWTLYMRAEERERDLHRWITIFSRRADGSYGRVDEHHVLRLYDPLQVEEMLRGVGFEVDDRGNYLAASAHGGPAGWRAFLGRRMQE